MKGVFRKYFVKGTYRWCYLMSVMYLLIDVTGGGGWWRDNAGEERWSVHSTAAFPQWNGEWSVFYLLSYMASELYFASPYIKYFKFWHSFCIYCHCLGQCVCLHTVCSGDMLQVAMLPCCLQFWVATWEREVGLVRSRLEAASVVILLNVVSFLIISGTLLPS